MTRSRRSTWVGPDQGGAGRPLRPRARVHDRAHAAPPRDAGRARRRRCRHGGDAAADGCRAGAVGAPGRCRRGRARARGRCPRCGGVLGQPRLARPRGRGPTGVRSRGSVALGHDVQAGLLAEVRWGAARGAENADVRAAGHRHRRRVDGRRQGAARQRLCRRAGARSGRACGAAVRLRRVRLPGGGQAPLPPSSAPTRSGAGSMPPVGADTVASLVAQGDPPRQGCGPVR